LFERELKRVSHNTHKYVNVRTPFESYGRQIWINFRQETLSNINARFRYERKIEIGSKKLRIRLDIFR